MGWEDWHFRSHDRKVQRRLEGSDLKAHYAYLEAKKVEQARGGHSVEYMKIWIDPEVAAIRDGLPEGDMTRKYRLDRIKRNRAIAMRVHLEKVRRDMQEKKKGVAIQDPVQRDEAEAFRANRREKVRVWNEEVERRQLASRALAEAHPGYVIPSGRTFEQYLQMLDSDSCSDL